MSLADMVPGVSETKLVVGVIVVMVIAASFGGLWLYADHYKTKAEQIQSDYDAFKAEVKANGEVKIAENVATKAQEVLLTSQKDKEHEDQDTLVANQFRATIDLMQRDAAKRATIGGVSTVPVDTKFCGDPKRDSGLSDAVQEYIDAARSALGQCRSSVDSSRTETAGLFKTATDQANSLTLLTTWVLDVSKIKR